MRARVDGFAAFERAVLALPEAALDALEGPLHAELEGVFAETQALCPIEDGDLVASGGLSDPIRAARQLYFTISYGGDNGEVAYALLQHEATWFAHAEGKSAKFVERPLDGWSGDGPRRAVEAAGRKLGAGGS
jgi:hypothetical protein